MNFLALLLGLALERMLTHLFRLCEFRWLNPLFDACLRRLKKQSHFAGGAAVAAVKPASRWSAVAITVLLAVVLVLPVAVLSAVLYDEMLRIPYFLFAVVVLLFSLGPRDLDDEVEDYLTALETGDEPARLRIAAQLLEVPSPTVEVASNESIERAIYVQANNRIFGVVFWFLVLGPSGAWAFRVLDLLRHRVEMNAEAVDAMAIDAVALNAVRTVHGVLAWPPSRLLSLGYALAGNFEDAMASWRNGARKAALPLAEGSTETMARVGTAASGRGMPDASDPLEAMDRVRGARALVLRTLWMIWCPVIAVLTLYDWLS
ncbi:MAG: regulatory signaling modulator protein AmpE [Gammaproteobacteria bacterium]